MSESEPESELSKNVELHREREREKEREISKYCHHRTSGPAVRKSFFSPKIWGPVRKVSLLGRTCWPFRKAIGVTRGESSALPNPVWLASFLVTEVWNYHSSWSRESGGYRIRYEIQG